MQSIPAEQTKRSLAVIILAAGLGTRMKSRTPKVLHHLCGRPMIDWISRAVASIAPDRTLVVLSDGQEEVHQFLPQRTEVVLQARQLGTGDAVRSCREALAGFDGDILVMYGDTPLITSRELQEVKAAHTSRDPDCTVMTMDVEDPTHYGRICRDSEGRAIKIVEHRDATAEELLICEVNAGLYIFDSRALWEALEQVGTDNVQGEVYLTDVIHVLANRNLVVQTHKVDDVDAALGVNSRLDLSRVEGIMRRRILERHMLAGVTVRDPGSTYVDAEVQIGTDSTLEPMTVLTGRTIVGDDCVIGPSTTLIDTAVDDGARVVSSHAVEAEIGTGCSVGPFAFLRPGARLMAGAKAGTFVEIKNSVIGEGAKVPHLSYIGDAQIGSGTNIGAGNITANYDGVNKHRTVIGSGVHTGADTTFVAPLSVGDGAMTGAGSVITGDVPAGALGIGRGRQKNIEDYARKKLGPGKNKGPREE